MIPYSAASSAASPPLDDAARQHLRIVDDPEPLTVVGDPVADEPICLFTIHDGDVVPTGALGSHTELIASRPELRSAFLQRRDWGANVLAGAIAEALGLRSYVQVALARALLDAGRFPGTSAPGVPPASRRAISPPVADLITGETKHEVTVRYYDGIARGLAQRLAQARLTLDVHTYTPDEPYRGSSPAIHMVSRRLRYPEHDQPPGAIFDPLFPPSLVGPTCNRSLLLQAVVDRAPDARAARLDHAYFMPEGSVEIRLQAWAFFRFLQRRFGETFPRTLDDVAYRATWDMLLDITRRRHEAELLRGYLHSYREAPDHRRKLFADARRAYAEIGRFLDLHEDTLIHGYRFSTERPSCIAIEVRKDLFYDIDEEAGTVQLRPDAHDNARTVARRVTPLVREHLDAFFPETIGQLKKPIDATTRP